MSEDRRLLVCPPVELADWAVKGLRVEPCQHCGRKVSVAPSSQGVLSRGAEITCYECAGRIYEEHEDDEWIMAPAKAWPDRDPDPERDSPYEPPV